MTTAEEILKRLVEYHHGFDDDAKALLLRAPMYCRILDDARAFLAREKVYAEMMVGFVRDGDRWDAYESNDEGYEVRIPVPASIHSPETLEGEVIEGGS